MQPEKEIVQCYEQMAIVEKYEAVISYLYPIAQSIPRKRSVIGAKRKIRRYLKNGDRESLGRFVSAWRGHAIHADACNLFNHLETQYGINCDQHS